LSVDWRDGSIVVTMRVTIWLVVLCLSSHVVLDLLGVPGVARHLRVAAAGGAPEPMPANPPIVIDTSRLVDQSGSHVTVRVYSATGLDSDAQRAALDVARSAFQAASVGIVWKICAQGGCDTPLAATDLAVRLVLAGDTRPGVRALGEALIDRHTRTGVLATVYVNRTLRLARELGIDHGRLLGRTVAHEVGHLLLASTTHGSGLMREVWSHDELLRPRRDDWILHPSDADAIRERLASARPVRPRPAS
jgi:hypothetical protein